MSEGTKLRDLVSLYFSTHTLFFKKNYFYFGGKEIRHFRQELWCIILHWVLCFSVVDKYVAGDSPFNNESILKQYFLWCIYLTFRPIYVNTRLIWSSIGHHLFVIVSYFFFSKSKAELFKRSTNLLTIFVHKEIETGNACSHWCETEDTVSEIILCKIVSAIWKVPIFLQTFCALHLTEFNGRYKIYSILSLEVDVSCICKCFFLSCAGQMDIKLYIICALNSILCSNGNCSHCFF